MSKMTVTAYLRGSTIGNPNSNGHFYLASLASTHKVEKFKLVREPDNPYDPHAILVHGAKLYKGQKYGYIEASIARMVSHYIDGGYRVLVTDYDMYMCSDGEHRSVKFTLEIDMDAAQKDSYRLRRARLSKI